MWQIDIRDKWGIKRFQTSLVWNRFISEKSRSIYHNQGVVVYLSRSSMEGTSNPSRVSNVHMLYNCGINMTLHELNWIMLVYFDWTSYSQMMLAEVHHTAYDIYPALFSKKIRSNFVHIGCAPWWQIGYIIYVWHTFARNMLTLFVNYPFPVWLGLAHSR